MVKTFIKRIQWSTSISPNVVKFSIDTDRIKNLMELVRENNLSEIRIRTNGEYFNDLNCEYEHDEFKAGVEMLVVFSHSFLFYAQHKYDNSAQIESEEILLTELNS